MDVDAGTVLVMDAISKVMDQTSTDGAMDSTLFWLWFQLRDLPLDQIVFLVRAVVAQNESIKPEATALFFLMVGWEAAVTSGG